jgi:hypothetical protein
MAAPRSRRRTCSRAIIDLLNRETDDSVRAAAVDALERLTGVKGHGSDYAGWQNWWEEVGQKTVHVANVSEERFRQQLDSADEKAREAKNDSPVKSLA